jgi:hypothetical protein
MTLVIQAKRASVIVARHAVRSATIAVRAGRYTFKRINYLARNHINYLARKHINYLARKRTDKIKEGNLVLFVKDGAF